MQLSLYLFFVKMVWLLLDLNFIGNWLVGLNLLLKEDFWKNRKRTEHTCDHKNVETYFSFEYSKDCCEASFIIFCSKEKVKEIFQNMLRVKFSLKERKKRNVSKNTRLMMSGQKSKKREKRKFKNGILQLNRLRGTRVENLGGVHYVFAKFWSMVYAVTKNFKRV